MKITFTCLILLLQIFAFTHCVDYPVGGIITQGELYTFASEYWYPDVLDIGQSNGLVIFEPKTSNYFDQVVTVIKISSGIWQIQTGSGKCWEAKSELPSLTPTGKYPFIAEEPCDDQNTRQQWKFLKAPLAEAENAMRIKNVYYGKYIKASSIKSTAEKPKFVALTKKINGCPKQAWIPQKQGQICLPSTPIYLINRKQELGTLDINTGVFTPLFKTDVVRVVASVNIDNLQYGTNGDSLYAINLQNGKTYFKGMFFSEERGIDAMAFGPNNILYGVESQGYFCTINTATGYATKLSKITNVGGYPSSFMWDPTTQQFFLAIEDENDSSLTRLLAITPQGTVTEIGSINFGLVQGMFLERDTLYGVTKNRELITISRTDAQATFVREITGTTEDIFSGSRALSNC